jgi:hypothetical protein
VPDLQTRQWRSQSHSHKELNSADNVSELGGEFFPRVSIKEHSLHDNLISARDTLSRGPS